MFSFSKLILKVLALSFFPLFNCQTSLNSMQSPFGHHALLFNDDIILKTDFTNFPTTQLTLEAWLSTSDTCHTGTVMSYAMDSKSSDKNQRSADFNHFIIFNPENLVACHDFAIIDLQFDFGHMSCRTAYNKSNTVNLVERDFKWHHLAVTWDGLNNGNMKIYSDGMLMAEAMNMSTRPLVSDGAFVLGAEQDCFGGCTDVRQGYYGMMDEVRIWRTVRSQEEIMKYMRVSDEFDNDDLVAYWKFDDPDISSDGLFSSDVARDSSKYGNHLFLRSVPTINEIVIDKNGQSLNTKAINFHNNYAIQPDFSTMPERDFTIEFWAKTGQVDPDSSEIATYADILSYATLSKGDGIVGNDHLHADSVFMDDTIRIQRYLTELQGTYYLTKAKVSTVAALSISINGNRQGNNDYFDNRLDFAVGWVDNDWHHIAVTWEYSSGKTQLFFDGEFITPFLVSSNGHVTNNDPSKGGVDPYLGAGVHRGQVGSLVLGKNQECYGGCFSPLYSFDGQIAVLRIWDSVLTKSVIQSNMMMAKPANTLGLKAAYYFNTSGQVIGGGLVSDEQGEQYLILGGDGPTWEYSDAPLVNLEGEPLQPIMLAQTYALRLHDQQVLIHSSFQNFPSNAITVEFWMKSVDHCKMGVPFSYATGDYRQGDNSFVIFNYNDWRVNIMQDKGTNLDRTSGIGATDGNWHHVAVSWVSKTGRVRLHQDGRLAWVITRGKGKLIPSGGTLVIGREQDCQGGCFDSAEGAVGSIEQGSKALYGSQDFFGVIDEMRIWDRELSSEEIRANWYNDLIMYSGDRKNFDKPAIEPAQDGLVAYWTFDEGSGYIVKDQTGNNHDLYILEDPNWVVVNYESSKRAMNVCGDGYLEGLEQCDDGNQISGDGCSSNCIIEEGYICTLSPSFCRRLGQDSSEVYRQATTQRSARLSEQLYPHATSPKSRQTQLNSTLVALIILLVIFLVVFGAMLIIYVKREWIYDHFPGVERKVRGFQDKFGSFGSNKLKQYQDFDVVAFDPSQSFEFSKDDLPLDSVGAAYSQLPSDTKPGKK